MQISYKSIFGASILAISAGLAVPAGAQSADSRATVDDQPADIIVTAQRRSESLQDVPVSLTVVSADMLKSRNLNEVNDLVFAAPSLQTGSDNQFAIRGVGTVAFADTLESSVATSVDEVNVGRTFGPGAVFNDVERVEVLSGPQGLLFGKNASAGLLNIVSRKPQMNVLSANFDVEAVYRDTTPADSRGVVTKATLNIPVTANSALRINGQYNYQEALTTFIGTGNSDDNVRSYGGRIKYLIEGDAWSLYLIGDYNKRTGVAGTFDRTHRALGAGSPLIPILANTGITPSENNFTYAGDGDYYRNEELGGVQGRIAYELPSGWEIVNIAAWRFSDRDQQLDTDLTNVQQLSINRRTARYGQVSNEFRVSIPDSNRLNGQFGIYYLDGKLDSEGQLAGFQGRTGGQLTNFPFCVGTTVAPACGTTRRDFFIGNDNEYRLDESNLAGFGQFFYKVTNALQLLAGARVTREKVSIDTNQNFQSQYFVPLGAAGRFVESYENTSFSWKLGGQYNLTPDIMAYATYGNGFKGAGFNDRATTANGQLLVLPEESKSLEAGLKTSWFNRALIVNLGLYRTKFDNYQVQSLDTAQQTFVIQNAAALTTKGAELTVLARPFSGFSLNASATFQESVFDDFPGAQCNVGAPCGPDGTYNARGTTLPNAPKFAGTVQAMYEADVAAGVSLVIEGNLYHRSSVNYRIGEPAVTRMGAVDVVGASVGLNLDSFNVRLFCRNCLDERVPSFINPVAGDANNGIDSSIQQFGFNSVRNIGLAFGARF